MSTTFDFIANTADGVFVVDREQTIVLWNQAATSILGYRSNDVLGRHCYGIVLGRNNEGCAVCRRDCDAIRVEERFDLPPTQDLNVRTKHGDDVWLNLSTIIVHSDTHELSVLIHLFREVSRQHELLSVVREFTNTVSGFSRNMPRRRESPSVPKDGPCAALTNREREILEHLTTGAATRVIAEHLCLSPRTVSNHVTNILGKLGVHSRLEAVTYSIRNGLV